MSKIKGYPSMTQQELKRSLATLEAKKKDLEERLEHYSKRLEEVKASSENDPMADLLGIDRVEEAENDVEHYENEIKVTNKRIAQVKSYIKDDDDSNNTTTTSNNNSNTNNDSKKGTGNGSIVSRVMKRAWEMYKDLKSKYGYLISRVNFGVCLKEAWAEAKA